MSKLEPAEPLWNWLAASDTRVAWTGVWPESGRPLRVEAAALGGRPVAFMSIGLWRTPWRSPSTDNDPVAYGVLLLSMATLILIGAGGSHGRTCGRAAAIAVAPPAGGMHDGRAAGAVGLKGPSGGQPPALCLVPAGGLHVGLLRRASLDHLSGTGAVRQAYRGPACSAAASATRSWAVTS